LKETSVVDGGSGLPGNASQKLIMLLDELPRLGVPKEQSANHLS
jgi:hypothetical protein